MLCLKADSGVLVVDDAVLARHATVEEVAGIYLHSRLVGIDVEHDAGLGAVELASHLGDVAFRVEHEVVVVAVAVLHLLIVEILDLLADHAGFDEVEGSAFHVHHRSVGHVGGVDGGDLGSVDQKQVVGHGGCWGRR